LVSVAATQFVRNVAHYRNEAQREPVAITGHGRTEAQWSPLLNSSSRNMSWHPPAGLFAFVVERIKAHGGTTLATPGTSPYRSAIPNRWLVLRLTPAR